MENAGNIEVIDITNYELFTKKYKYYFQFCKFGIIIILIAFIFHKWNDKRN